MSEYFPKPKPLGKLEVGLHLSNYETKADLKNAAGIDTLSLSKKVVLTSLKSK